MEVRRGGLGEVGEVESRRGWFGKGGGRILPAADVDFFKGALGFGGGGAGARGRGGGGEDFVAWGWGVSGCGKSWMERDGTDRGRCGGDA